MIIIMLQSNLIQADGAMSAPLYFMHANANLNGLVYSLHVSLVFW